MTFFIGISEQEDNCHRWWGSQRIIHPLKRHHPILGAVRKLDYGTAIEELRGLRLRKRKHVREDVGAREHPERDFEKVVGHDENIIAIIEPVRPGWLHVVPV